MPRFSPMCRLPLQMLGHRRVHRDGGLVRGVGDAASHSPRGGVEARMQQRARQLHERLVAASPSPHCRHARHALVLLRTWLVGAKGVRHQGPGL